MIAYIVRRILLACMTLLLVTMLIYGLIRAMPGGPLSVLQSTSTDRELKKEEIQRFEKSLGLDLPWYSAYLSWLGNLVRGDMGDSFTQFRPVTKIIGERVGPTLLLSITSIGLAYILSIPIGLYSSVRANKPDERIIGMILYMLYSLPGFVAALFLQIVFAVKLGWLPLLGMSSADYSTLSFGGKVLDIFKHAVLPIAVYTYGSLAFESRFIRANMQEVLRQDYIRTAYAKGLSPFRVIVHHAFRNTLIPFVTMLGLMLPALLSGSVIVEQIFAWPGMGRLFFESILGRDYPTIMGLVVVFSTLTLIGQLLSDILYAVVDPRVSYQ